MAQDSFSESAHEPGSIFETSYNSDGCLCGRNVPRAALVRRWVRAKEPDITEQMLPISDIKRTSLQHRFCENFGELNVSAPRFSDDLMQRRLCSISSENPQKCILRRVHDQVDSARGNICCLHDALAGNFASQ
jgi:hypothetical protein